MKNFFKYMLASMLGVGLIFAILFFIMMGALAGIGSKAEKSIAVKEKSVLVLSFKTPVLDRNIYNPYDALYNGFNFEKGIGLNQYVAAIENAKTDKNIEGIYLKVSNVEAGPAILKEIRDALVDFKTSGKFMVAYGEVYSQNAYYLASAADKVILQKEGMVSFQGISMKVMFYKHLMAKLGIDMQVIRHGKFKSAVEPFINDKMSPENKLQYVALSQSMWNTFIGDVSKDRNLSASQLNIIADSLFGFFPDQALKVGLVDSLANPEEVNLYMASLISGAKKQDSKETSEKESPALNTIDIEQYVHTLKNTEKASDKIAVVYALGEIGMDKGNNQSIGTENISDAIRKAAKDKTVKAIVLRVNSPGGAVITSELIREAVLEAKKLKPVVASFGTYAASGGYWISCCCNKIIAQPNSITGSIGVFGLIPNLKKTFNEKIGITYDLVNTNRNSDFPNVFRPLTPYEELTMQKNINNIYKKFISIVSQGRNLSIEKVDSIGEGRVWTGAQALELGLVDELG